MPSLSNSPFPGADSAESLRLAAAGKVGLWDWDLVTNEVKWTDSLYALHGVDRATFNASLENYTRLVHPGDLPRVKTALQRTLELDAPYEIEFRIQRPDGKTAWVFANATVLRQDGRAIRLTGATVDITARRDGDEVSRRLAAIVESSDDAIISTDLAGLIATWNAGAQRLFGHTAREAIGRPVTFLIPPAREGEETKILDRIRRGERIEHYETVRQHKDGSLIDVSLTVSPLKDATGRAIGASKIARDITDRKKSEAALRLSEERFRLLSSHAPVGIFLSDARGGCAFVNERWCEMAGLTLAQAQGDGWADALHPADRAGVLAGWREAVAAGRPSTSEFRFQRPDGRVVWLHSDAVRIKEGGELAPGYLGSCVDITERKQAELQAAFLHDLGDQVSGLTDPDQIMDVAQAALGEHLAADRCYFFEMIQSENLAIVRRDWRRPDLPPTAGNHPLDQFGSPEFLTWLAQPRKGIADVMSHPVTRDNTAGYTALSMRGLATSTFSKKGQRLLSLAVSTRQPRAWAAAELDLIENVTARVWPAIERARAAQALRAIEQTIRESERQLRLVTDHAPIFLAHCDRSHRYKFVNRTYAERYGRTVEDIVGRHVSELTGDEAYATFRHHMDNTLTGRRIEFEQEIPYSTLGRRWVHVIYEPERNGEGEVVGLVAVIVDITARKQVEMELERARDDALAASRAKDDFLAALSHELRTPLNPVLLLASDSANNPALPADIRGGFKMIRDNISLEARLIDDLLDLTRITRGKLLLEKQPVDIHAVLQDALANLRAETEARRLELGLSLGARQTTVLGDPVRLQQVLWNVLKNAVKFTPEGGQVRITSRLAPGQERLVIEVADSGIGMLPAELAQVFEAFAQGDHAAGTGLHRFGGLGLGLTISRKLVEMHAGQIHATSPGRNQGSVFAIELPLMFASGAKPDPHPAEIAAEAGTAPPRPAGSILLVEDHASTRETVQKLLTRRHYEVVAAATAAAARELAGNRAFNFVVSDVGLPDGDGYELMTQLLKLQPSLQGIAMSGYGMEDDLLRSQAAGFAAHLVKPVSISALEQALARLSRPTSPSSST